MCCFCVLVPTKNLYESGSLLEIGPINTALDTFLRVPREPCCAWGFEKETALIRWPWSKYLLILFLLQEESVSYDGTAQTQCPLLPPRGYPFLMPRRKRIDGTYFFASTMNEGKTVSVGGGC